MSARTEKEPRDLRVLVVEDSEDDAFLLVRELKRGGYRPLHRRVYTADDMRRALDEETWDIVVCDHSMPAFDSSAALEVLHERGYPDIPFMIVSGKIGEEAAVSAMRLGAHDYFMKENLARLNTAIERELREADNRRERRRAREDLRRSEERYRTFVAQSTEGIWRAELEEPLDTTLPPDEQLDLLYERLYFAEANDAMARMYGYRHGENLTGMRLESFMPRGDPASREFLKSGLENGYRVTDTESRETDRWGEERYFLNNFVGIVESGMLERIWGTQRDVTSRKQAEKALREAEEKYRSIFENAVEGIYQTTLSGKLLTANPTMARIFGYPSVREMLEIKDVGQTLYADPDDRERFAERVRRFGEVTGYEVKMVRKDGSEVWVSLAGRALADENGEFAGFEGTTEDISARRAAEEARRESEAIYRSVVENASEGIFVIEVGSQRILEANDFLRRSLGYSAADLAGMTLAELIAGSETRPGLDMTPVLERGTSRLGEMMFLRKDGSLAEVEVGASFIPYGGSQAVCIVAHDISDRRRMERVLGEIREAERKRISRDLHDGVLQDLTFALNSIQIERRIHGGRRKEEGEQVKLLQRALGGLREAIYDLRLDGPEEQTLRRSVESIIELNRQTNQGCEISLEVARDFPENVAGAQAMEVVRIVQEALTNVRRHSGAKNCLVSLGMDRDELSVTVGDDGVGFPAGQPAGIGLESMRERAETLGGRLLVEGEAGTTVTLSVPASVMHRGRAGNAAG
ncbi:PAS domain S-box protein [Rubrobacter indicoceani]|uniref:hybrid sensor histidine kinase/response regulator n=1 Tax=Rubrobacter indicoceani TaxID=2051957 RepID=UPI0013C4B9EA|nr:PAS domain S-box protein [Rubrobacter indicoceani]